ncbi:hypothetical protein V866_003729 [Kwoniella sp. B9012]|uniref:Uncharacterized protein n=1 Tax=Kwoniella europaea PYCC6329 TaxID=1423913 RepID=A0AAX4KJB5_9TREE
MVLYSDSAIPVLFMFLLSFSPTKISKLDLIHCTSKVNVTTILPVQEEAKIKLAFGPSGGCMWFDKKDPICQSTFHLHPSPTYLHLPENETLTERLGNTNGLALVHIVTGLVSLDDISWMLGPFIPGCFEVSNALMLLATFWGMITFLVIAGYKLSIDKHLKGDSAVPEFKTEYGGGLGIFVVGLFFILCGLLGTVGTARKIKRKDPPPVAKV